MLISDIGCLMLVIKLNIDSSVDFQTENGKIEHMLHPKVASLVGAAFLRNDP